MKKKEIKNKKKKMIITIRFENNFKSSEQNNELIS